MIKLFMNKGQIDQRLLNSKATDLDWYYSRHYQKLKFLVHDLLFMIFVKNPPDGTRNSCEPSDQILIFRVSVNSFAFRYCLVLAIMYIDR